MPPHLAVALGRVSPVHGLGSTAGLALEVWVHASWPEGTRAGELTLPPADGSTGWSSLSTAGELSLLVQIRKSWWADQLSYLLPKSRPRALN